MLGASLQSMTAIALAPYWASTRTCRPARLLSMVVMVGAGASVLRFLDKGVVMEYSTVQPQVLKS